MKTVPSPGFTGMICRLCLFVIIYPGDLTRCSTSTLDEIVFILPFIPCTNPKKSRLSSSKIESILEKNSYRQFKLQTFRAISQKITLLETTSMFGAC